MIAWRDLVVVVPVDGAGRNAPGPGMKERVRGMLGHSRLVFPSLAVGSDGLAGVLLTSRGNTGPVAVNGCEAKLLWRRGNRRLLAPGPFRRGENVLAARCGAGELLLDPVFADIETAQKKAFPPTGGWRMEKLDGRPLGDAALAERSVASFSSVLEGLAHGLAHMVAPTGDVWSFFDLTSHCHRLPGWRWDTGIVLEALAGAAERLDDSSLLTAAQTVGDRLLATQLRHPECPGGFPEWTDLRFSESTNHVSQWVAPFNGAFIAPGLARMAGMTGRSAYLQAAKACLRLAVERGLTPAGGVSGYYFENSRRWSYLGQINDSGILGRGLAFLPGEAWAAGAASRAMEYILDKAARPDGHIARAWWDGDSSAPPGEPLFPEWKRHPQRVVSKIFSRGQGWVLLGLAGALRLGAGVRIAHEGRLLKAFILGTQQADGSWLYSQNQPELGACAKTTAALALALAEWSVAAGEPLPLSAINNALQYLEDCRRPGLVPAELSGLPVDGSKEGCIIYLRDRPVVCAYAGALEVLVRLAVEDRQ